MIKSTKALFSQILLFLMCFALFCFMPGCGGSAGGGTAEELTYTLTVTTTPAVDTFQAGETVTIIATVTGSDGLPASGYAVTFTDFRNNSGGTLTVAGTGTTDGDGRAQATYTLGSNDADQEVEDTIEVSIPGSSETLIINRAATTSSTGELTYTITVETTPVLDAFQAGETATITATVTGSNGLTASGYAVTFTVFRNNSGGTLAIAGIGATDENGRAQATYTLGSNNITEAVSDTIEVSIPGSSKTLTINRAAKTYSLVVAADKTSLLSGEVATITATLTDNNGPASGQAVSFLISTNQSGGTIAIGGTGTTDVNGQAVAYYTMGPQTALSIQDVINVSALNVSQSITISQLSQSTVSVASLDILASPTSIKTDNSNTSTITINALSEGNALLSGAIVNLSTDTGILSAPSVTTNAETPATVTLSCGSNKNNRLATVTATTASASGDVTVTTQIMITGSTVSITSGSSSMSTTGSMTLTVTVKDASGSVVPSTSVSLAQAPTDGTSGSVTFDADTKTTNNSGIATFTVYGRTNGNVAISAASLGATASTILTITDISTVFYIDQQRLCAGYTDATCSDTTFLSGNPDPSAMHIGQILKVRVNVPAPTTQVVFATTQGTFHNTGNTSQGNSITVDVDASNKATAYLTTTLAGLSTVSVYTPGYSTSDSLAVGMTSNIPYEITVEALPDVVPKSIGSTTGSSTISAMVRDAGGFPVGGMPVIFSIIHPTGGGEAITPAVAVTASVASGGLKVGEARASFTSGTLPSGQSSSSVIIRASVVGYSVATGTSPSGNDANIVIGGEAGSIAFGMATELGKDESNANYTLEMSAVVADSSGNPVPEGTIVNLSLWPVAWSTGSNCSYDYGPYNSALTDDDNDLTTPRTDDDGIVGVDPWIYNTGTFCAEDKNENLYLDTASGEDGSRFYYDEETNTCTNIAGNPFPGSQDGFITPVNSRAGAVPATVITDANGVAKFTMTYPITSAIWTIVRLRGSTYVQGTETVGQVIWRLAATSSDIGPPCRITGSPYSY